jgi:glycerol-3-phosphate acyltransferase PlsY
MYLLYSILSILVAYLLGSIPFGLVASYLFKGVDIRKHGTGNIGASNVMLAAGPKAAALVLICDILKGVIAVLLARALTGSDWVIAASALASVLGHDYSIFLRGQGGKGFATASGAVIGIDINIYLIGLLLYILLLLVIRYWMLSTVLILFIVPILMWMTFKSSPIILFGVANALLALYQHRKDLIRIFSGDEPTVFEWLGKLRKK